MRAPAVGIMALGFTMLSALIFILMGIVFYFVNVWIIKVGAGFAGFKTLDGNWVVLTAGFLTAASIIASAIRR